VSEDRQGRRIAELEEELERMRTRKAADDERLSELLDAVSRSTRSLDGLSKRLEAVAAGSVGPDDLKADAVIVRAMRTELCRRGDAFLTDTQDLGPKIRITGQWKVPTPALRKKGPRGRTE
jgi:septal ring factor EnvC (AmiA/AmiB activator)